MSKSNTKVVKEQPRKDSNDPRINLDNTRESRAIKDMSGFKRRQSEDWKKKNHSGPKYGSGRKQRRNTKSEDQKGKDFKPRKDNDYSFYNKNPQLITAASSVAWVSNLGADYDLLKQVPGVLAMYYTPTFNNEEIMNQIKASYYSYVVHANSRNYRYDDSDLMLVTMAAFEVFECFANMRRAYGVIRQYQGLDQYTPRILVSAMGFNYVDLKNNLHKMWFDLNNLVAQMTSIWVPSIFPILQRRLWMSDTVYRDAGSAKAQYYIFVRDNYFWLDGSATGGFALKAVSMEGSTLTQAEDVGIGDYLTSNMLSISDYNENYQRTLNWDQWVQICQFMIDKLLSVQDRGMIMGDVLNAYGADKIFAIPEVPIDYVVPYQYDTKILSQIENATITQASRPLAVYQNTANDRSLCPVLMHPADYRSKIAFSVVGGMLSFSGTGVRPINYHGLTAPSNEEIVYMTRLMAQGYRSITECTGKEKEEDVQMIFVKRSEMLFGTEQIVEARVYRTDSADGFLGTYSSNHVPQMLIPSTLNGYLATSADINRYINNLLYEISAFDWHPILFGANNQTDFPAGLSLDGNLWSDSSMSYSGCLTSLDFDNYAFISESQVAQLHKACYISEWDMPAL